MVTQREAYYTLIQHFRHQSEFNDTLQGRAYSYMCTDVVYCVYVDVVALTGCARASLGICASTSGALAGCVLWKVSYIM